MINNGLQAERYHSKSSHILEKEAIFTKLWIFAGLTTLCSKTDSFISRVICGIPIFIQNTKGEFSAFINSCPHRLSPIRTNDFGIKKITCPYHGWNFSNEGKLLHIPNEHLYNFTESQKCSISLRKISLNLIGKFIFINFNDEPININEQFSNDLRQDLESVSDHIDSQTAFGRFPLNHNWKLNVEVVKDPNHIPFVHPKTFMSWVQNKDLSNAEAIRLTEWAAKDNIKLTELSFKTQSSIIDSLPWYRNKIKRFKNSSDHISWYLFPNTHIGAVRGDYFFIQQYDPIDESSIDFNLWIMTAEKLDKSEDFSALLRALMTAEREIIQEDAIFLARIQNNLNSFSSSPNHGAYEKDIIYQNIYLNKI
jgi:phenylpropionate dioxygenase-like ring-hydroxylating dioxygenase large terminal subunit